MYLCLCTQASHGGAKTLPKCTQPQQMSHDQHEVCVCVCVCICKYWINNICKLLYIIRSTYSNSLLLLLCRKVQCSM